ncbi:MAG TPA: glycoside hydrolase family 38 C-terminal domain-containing protein [Candidatus Hydrogenedentes bacterium]|nr:glycoside hydrolase family 38 C-terminal domain-containing protein [Candidatus Hydrogenedentota bacterium]
MMGRVVTRFFLVAVLPVTVVAAAENDMSETVFVVPNFHPASCGWLTDFSHERLYCANSYLDHLDRVAADGAYAFVISEVNTMIAIGNFTPARFEELKQRLAEGRVEAVNAFFLEPTICLSGGEALVKQGVEGLRWQERMLGVRPRHCWAIDVTGMHEQMPQIAEGLGLDTLVHCRMNNFGSTLYWGQSPDGTRILTVSPGHYNEWPALFRATEALNDAELRKLIDDGRSRERRTSLADVPTMRTPDGAPTLVLAGSGDYSLAPLYARYPGEFLEQWKKAAPDVPLRFATFGDYVDAVKPGIASGTIAMPTVTGGWNFTYFGFWIQNPAVKQRYRRAEHALEASEMLATIASLRQNQAYPAQDLYHAWLLMLLNMDRNTLWGAAGGMVFEHPQSWDVEDRFDWVDTTCGGICEESIRKIRGDGEAITLFNPANWRRKDPIVLQAGIAPGLAGIPCQTLPGGALLCRPDMPPAGFASYAKAGDPAAASRGIGLPAAIETAFYTVRIDPKTGDLISLKLKPSGRELLAGPANVLIAESPTSPAPGNIYFGGNDMDFRPKRERRGASNDFPCRITAYEGPLAMVVEVTGEFYGGKQARRVMTFYRDHPRLDFDAYLEDIPDQTVVVAEFPLAPKITVARRGIPYGFSQGAWPEPTDALNGYMKGITPAVRWSHYAFEDGWGAAILDRGLPGREIDGNTPLIFLLNAVDNYMGYPCAWLSGKGAHRLQYAVIAHEGDWRDARIPRAAWEYNSTPAVASGTAKGAEESFLRTSDNVIVEAARREEGVIEVRMAECLGIAGEASLTVDLPHESAALTDLVGKRAKPLSGGPEYRFDIRPQQIVTVRLQTGSSVDPVTPLTDWAPLVPEHKRPALRAYDPAVKGHPPHG